MFLLFCSQLWFFFFFFLLAFISNSIMHKTLKDFAFTFVFLVGDCCAQQSSAADSLRATAGSVTTRTTSVTATTFIYFIYLFSFILVSVKKMCSQVRSPITFVRHLSNYEQMAPDHYLGLTYVVYWLGVGLTGVAYIIYVSAAWHTTVIFMCA